MKVIDDMTAWMATELLESMDREVVRRLMGWPSDEAKDLNRQLRDKVSHLTKELDSLKRIIGS